MQFPNREAALALVRAGLHIFPCNPDKTPRIAGWESAASSSPFQVGIWWNASPEALPAIPVGPHGIVVIDCDRRAGINGVAAFTALCADHRIDLSNAFVVETPSSGIHYYFSTQTPFGNSRGSLPDGIDVRGVGGYVIAPGATLPDGRCYRIVAGSWDAIPPLPEPLAVFLKAKRPVTAPEPSVSRPEPTQRERDYAERALADECETLAAMRPGEGRNAALNRAAHSIGTMAGAGWIDPEAAARALWEAAERNGYVAKDGEATALRTLQSGIDSGMAKPRDPRPAIEADAPFRESVANLLAAHKAKQSSAPGSLVEFLESIKPLQEYDIPPITYLINGMMPQGSLIMLSGGPGSGKSTLAMKVAFLASEGLPIFGTPQVARRALYLDRDNAPAVVKDRMMRLRMTPNHRFKYWGGHLGVDVPQRVFSDPGLLEWLQRDKVRPILVIDSQIAFQEGKETDSNDIRAFYDPLRQLTYRGVTVIVIHHTGKGESTKEFRGSEDIKAALDVGYVVNNSCKVGLDKLTLSAFKARVIVQEEIALTYEDGDFIPQDLRHAKEDGLTQLLRANSGVTKNEFERVAMELRFSRSDVRNFIDTGIGYGRIITRKGDRNATLLYPPESVPVANAVL